jgi:hypothetical protein
MGGGVVASAVAARVPLKRYRTNVPSIWIRLLLTCGESLTQFARQSITIGAKRIVGISPTRIRKPRKVFPAGPDRASRAGVRGPGNYTLAKCVDHEGTPMYTNHGRVSAGGCTGTGAGTVRRRKRQRPVESVLEATVRRAIKRRSGRRSSEPCCCRASKARRDREEWRWPDRRSHRNMQFRQTRQNAS